MTPCTPPRNGRHYAQLSREVLRLDESMGPHVHRRRVRPGRSLRFYALYAVLVFGAAGLTLIFGPRLHLGLAGYLAVGITAAVVISALVRRPS